MHFVPKRNRNRNGNRNGKFVYKLTIYFDLTLCSHKSMQTLDCKERKYTKEIKGFK